MEQKQHTALLEQLRKWHDEDEHERIIDAVETIRKLEKRAEAAWEEEDYEIASCYARALNNVRRYEEALDVLLRLRGTGETDCYWHFRVGYSLYYLDREAEAAGYFKRALALGDEYEDTLGLLKSSVREALAKEEPFNPLPRLQDEEIRRFFEDPWDFLLVFFYKYLRVIEANPEERLSRLFNNAQLVLLGYYYLERELENGGRFFQLPQDGYEYFIFDPLFAKTLSAWGAKKIARIVKEMKAEYIKQKEAREAQEKESGGGEWPEQYYAPDFSRLAPRFFRVFYTEAGIIRRFIEEHSHEFCSFSNPPRLS
jgi:hypothetical protein